MGANGVPRKSGVRLRLKGPDDCGAILDKALAHDGPVVVDAIVDGQEPPLPAKIVKTVAKDKVKEMV